MKLSLRLSAIASLINKEDKIADIGCDHALLDIYLIKNNYIKESIASDANQNALNNAINNIKKYKLEKYITPILSDGLEKINLKQINTLVISGMGAYTVIEILKDIKNISSVNKIIIQANNNNDVIRKFLNQNGFNIDHELVVLDHNKYYQIIMFKRSKSSQKYSSFEYLYGPLIIKSNEEKYFKYLIKKNKQIIANLPMKQFIKKLKLIIDNHKLRKLLSNN